MLIKSTLARHRGWQLEIPATRGEAKPPLWTPIGGESGIEIAEAADCVLPGDKPEHLAVVKFFDNHTVVKYNGPDGQPLYQFRGPSAAPTS